MLKIQEGESLKKLYFNVRNIIILIVWKVQNRCVIIITLIYNLYIFLRKTKV